MYVTENVTSFRNGWLQELRVDLLLWKISHAHNRVLKASAIPVDKDLLSYQLRGKMVKLHDHWLRSHLVPFPKLKIPEILIGQARAAGWVLYEPSQNILRNSLKENVLLGAVVHTCDPRSSGG